jgi:hypothetical protein
MRPVSKAAALRNGHPACPSGEKHDFGQARPMFSYSLPDRRFNMGPTFQACERTIV